MVSVHYFRIEKYLPKRKDILLPNYDPIE